MRLKLFMSKLSNVLLLIGSVLTATSYNHEESPLRTEESLMHHQRIHDILHVDSDSNNAINRASSLDASTLRIGGVAALNAIKSTGVLGGYFSTIVYGDDDCSGSNVFGFGFLLGACVVDYEFETSTRREATDTTVTIYSFDDTACMNANQASPSILRDYNEGICTNGEKQFLRATIDIPLSGQSITERYS